MLAGIVCTTMESVNSLQMRDCADAHSFNDGFSTPKKKATMPLCFCSFTPECEEEMKPAVGMAFEDVKAVEEFYKMYAHHVGFSVRVGQQKLENKVVQCRRFMCSRSVHGGNPYVEHNGTQLVGCHSSTLCKRCIFQSRRRQEEAWKMEAIARVTSERKDRDQIETSLRSEENLLHLKADNDMQRYKSDICVLEQQISQLKVSLDSSNVDAPKWGTDNKTYVF